VIEMRGSIGTRREESETGGIVIAEDGGVRLDIAWWSSAGNTARSRHWIVWREEPRSCKRDMVGKCSVTIGFKKRETLEPVAERSADVMYLYVLGVGPEIRKKDLDGGDESECWDGKGTPNFTDMGKRTCSIRSRPRCRMRKAEPRIRTCRSDFNWASDRGAGNRKAGKEFLQTPD